MLKCLFRTIKFVETGHDFKLFGFILKGARHNKVRSLASASRSLHEFKNRNLNSQITKTVHSHHVNSFHTVLPTQNKILHPLRADTKSNVNEHNQQTTLNMGLVNARSCRNKTSKIADFVLDHGLDVLGLTETWLRPGERDFTTRSKLTPPGYLLLDVPRVTGKGGGVGVLLKESAIKLEQHNVCPQSSYESLEIVLDTKSSFLTLLVVYRPPRTGKRGQPPDVFFHEFSDHMNALTSTDHALVVGDFNFHFEKTSKNVTRFKKLLSKYDLQQYVTESTHTKGHILDLVISRGGAYGGMEVRNHGSIVSDHAALSFQWNQSVSSASQSRLPALSFYGN